MPTTFRANVRTFGEVAIVDVSGRIVLGDGSKELRAKLADLVSAGQTKIVLNIGDVTYLDSSGLGELVSAYSSAANAGGKIKLLNLQPRIAELLKITHLANLFESFSGEPEAVASFGDPQAASA